MNSEGIVDLPLLRTLITIRQKSREPSFWKAIKYFVLIEYARLAASRTFFAIITSLFEFYLRFKNLLYWYKQKCVFYELQQSKSSWKPCRWVRLDLIFTMRDIYINSNMNPPTKFTNSSRCTEFKTILPQNISLTIMKTIPINTRMLIS